VTGDLRSRSRVILDGPDRAQARAYLKGIGFDDDALQRPIVGIANTWTETMPCNFHLRRLAEKVKEGVRAAGATPMEFNTIAISDGITMGTQGMKTSLVSREVIADSIELVARGHMFDAVVALSGCDKTIPGCVMALARLDVPGLMLYGGSIAPGRHWRPRRGRPHGRRAHGPRGPRLAGRRGLRRPVHGEHDGHGLRGARHIADGQLDGSSRGRQKGEGGRGVRAARARGA
jgi:dihydroxyacid dehydratase/phosphogluconate dehydratase